MDCMISLTIVSRYLTENSSIVVTSCILNVGLIVIFVLVILSMLYMVHSPVYVWVGNFLQPFGEQQPRDGY